MITIASLCTGYGGLDQGVHAMLGGRVVITADTDKGASKIIAARYPDAPNVGDLTTADWSAYGPVDVVTAGWPCQPFSQAGKRKGAADERAIWPGIARAVHLLRPRYVVLENVAAIANRSTGPELARAVGDLAALGYVGSWLCLRASDVGAPHRRERIFIFAADSRRLSGDTWRISEPREAQSRRALGEPERRGVSAVALLPTPDATHGRKSSRTGPLLPGVVELLPTPNASVANDGESVETWEARRARTKDRVRNGNGFGMPLSIAAQLLPTPRATDGTKGGPNQPGSSGDAWGHYRAAIHRWEQILGRPAPWPTVNGRLNPVAVEFMMGLPAGWVTDVPGLSRSAQLKALGNGVVPQQAAAAVRFMLGERVAA